MTSQTTVRENQLQQALERWREKPITTKAVLERVATTYPGIIFRDHCGHLALTTSSDAAITISRATIKSYLPVRGYRPGGPMP